MQIYNFFQFWQKKIVFLKKSSFSRYGLSFCFIAMRRGLLSGFLPTGWQRGFCV